MGSGWVGERVEEGVSRVQVVTLYSCIFVYKTYSHKITDTVANLMH